MPRESRELMISFILLAPPAERCFELKESLRVKAVYEEEEDDGTAAAAAAGKGGGKGKGLGLILPSFLGRFKFATAGGGDQEGGGRGGGGGGAAGE